MFLDSSVTYVPGPYPGAPNHYFSCTPRLRTQIATTSRRGVIRLFMIRRGYLNGHRTANLKDYAARPRRRKPARIECHPSWQLLVESRIRGELHLLPSRNRLRGDAEIRAMCRRPYPDLANEISGIVSPV